MRCELVSTIVGVPDEAPHIGTLRETPLHASLKRWYAEPGDRFEVAIDGFVIDIVRDDLLIEVQTSGFSSMRPKVSRLLAKGWPIRIAHPVPVDKWIVKVDGDGTVLSRRRSPKHGHAADVFGELVSFPELMMESNLEIDVLLTTEEEYRRHQPGMAWRRRGWVVFDRRLLEVVDTRLLSGPEDLATLLPEDLAETFTTAELTESLGVTRRTAQQMAYCLRKTGVITAVGKTGNAVEYRVA